VSDTLVHLNGINALTGEPLVAPMSLDDAERQARGESAPGWAGWLRKLAARLVSRPFALPAEVSDPNDLAQVGWGVVFAADTPAEVRAALRPLLDRRAGQAGRLYKEFDHRPGEEREAWLGRHKVHGADVEPERVPYFLLLVGDPVSIPFEFQCLLDIDYVVGRLTFDPPEEYASYATAVVEYETAAAPPTAREVLYWGTRHPLDRATQLSADKLVAPLNAAGANPGDPSVAAKYGFASRCLLAADATRTNLLEALHARSGPAPALLFTASHGMGGWPKGDPRERTANGALLCQDWPGVGPVKPEQYLTAAEVESDARLLGRVVFLFACYGAGTPRHDAFLKNPTGGPLEVAEAPFVSALAKRLLAGGALAVVGHVERAWGYSLADAKAGAQIQPFRNLMVRLLRGERVGQATLDFSRRYATYSAELLTMLDPSRPAAVKPAAAELVNRWVERNDAQYYVVLGDPAARLRVEDTR